MRARLHEHVAPEVTVAGVHKLVRNEAPRLTPLVFAAGPPADGLVEEIGRAAQRLVDAPPVGQAAVLWADRPEKAFPAKADWDSSSACGVRGKGDMGRG